MIAIINGVVVQGSPEEIERYRQITTKKENKFFNVSKDVIPEHVKKYRESKHEGWHKEWSPSELRAFFVF
jgi:hypothetical protein